MKCWIPWKMPDKSIPKDAAYQIINDDRADAGWEPEVEPGTICHMDDMDGTGVRQAVTNENFVDMDEYSVPTELQVK
ncbi:Glutamate decarboxylase [Carex littledalei]|uniref:Glutamate decarboxylase n=1 Tax=Carex littledalei TaxID=544730 RepID=A0A833VG33_9POAL|nr:Glutamate decarboxylase [Carex littledalei]